jgi:hypothetical protein
MGWAMVYSGNGSVFGAEISVLEVPSIPKTTPLMNDHPSIGSQYADHMKMFDKVYDFIRFHHKYSYIPPVTRFSKFSNALSMKIYDKVQVPTGQDLPAMIWPTGDAVLDLYRSQGDARYNTGPYAPTRQIIADSSHPELFNASPAITIEAM